MARDAWTDERLDDLNQRVSNLDHRMEEGFREMREEFRAVRDELGGLRTEFGGQLAALHQMILQLFVGMIVTLILGFGGMTVAFITQT